MVCRHAFTFVQHTDAKAQSRYRRSDLDPAVQPCVLDTYLSQVTFANAPMVPWILREEIAFPVLLAAGRKPLVPRTPVFFPTPG